MSELGGRVAIITGAGSGIGEAVARALDAEGMRLVLTGRREERLDEVARGLREAVAVPGDITDAALPDALVERSLAAFGQLDVAVNNAGMIESGAIDDLDLDRMARMVRVNVEAAFRFAHVALRHFKAQDRGHLINTSSLLGTTVRAGIGAYAGTKHALEGLTHALRLELARTAVRLSNIQPGLVLTELHAHMDRHPKDAQGIEHPLAPEDIARAVVFVLQQPEHVQVNSIQVVPKGQEL